MAAPDPSLSPRPVRPLLLATWLSGLLGMAVDVAFEHRLPPDLRAHLASSLDRPFGLVDGLAAALALLALVLSILGTARLVRLRLDGRGPFAASFALAMGLLLTEPMVQTPPGAALYFVSCVSGGALLGWRYLPPRG